MPVENEILLELHGGATDVKRQIFYALTRSPECVADRTARLLGSWIELAHERGLVTQDEINEMILATCR